LFSQKNIHLGLFSASKDLFQKELITIGWKRSRPLLLNAASTNRETLFSSFTDSFCGILFQSTMARRKKKPHAHDKMGFGPVRCNTVGRCTSVQQQSCVAVGTPSHIFFTEDDEKDILVNDKIGIVNRSCSDPPFNNRQMPTSIVTKPCHSSIEENFLMVPPPAKDLPSTTIKNHNDNEVYVVDFIKEKFFKRRKCLMHSINSWKETVHLDALEAFAQGERPRNFFARKEKTINDACGWIICQRCLHAICSKCAEFILQKILLINVSPQQSNTTVPGLG
jgi:hypothetical protein